MPSRTAAQEYWQMPLASPFGPMQLTFSPRGLCALRLGEKLTAPAPEPQPGPEPEIAAETLRALGKYFAGQPEDFARVAVDLEGTEFQRRVWQAAREIPFGQTISYGELARRLGIPQGPRAVGQALGANRLLIVVPCHRVLGQGGTLGGFSGGLHLKRLLLSHERTALGGEPYLSFGPTAQARPTAAELGAPPPGQSRKLWPHRKLRHS